LPSTRLQGGTRAAMCGSLLHRGRRPARRRLRPAWRRPSGRSSLGVGTLKHLPAWRDLLAWRLHHSRGRHTGTHLRPHTELGGASGTRPPPLSVLPRGIFRSYLQPPQSRAFLSPNLSHPSSSSSLLSLQVLWTSGEGPVDPDPELSGPELSTTRTLRPPNDVTSVRRYL